MRWLLVIALIGGLVACGGAPPEPAPAPRAAFACGALSCDAHASYCEMIKTDVPSLPSTYACQPLPAACEGAGRCGCFPAGARCDYCAELDTGGARHVQRSCVGGR